MLIFLQILGAVFLGIVLLILFAWMVMRAKLRGLAGMAGQFEDMKYAEVPARLHLVKRESVDWKDPDAVRQLVDPLLALGFQDGGLYETQELDYLRLHSLVYPSESVYAVVYEHEKAGVWTDLVSRYEDGTSVTYATTAQGGGLDQRPGHSISRHPELGPEALYRKLLAERPQRPLKQIAPTDFKPTFEKAYADEMDWRNSRGGPTEEELRAVAAASGREMNEEELAALKQQLAQNAAAALEESLKERFVESTTMSAREWEAVRERVVIVHDRMTKEMVGSAFYNWQVDEDEEWEEDEDEDEEADRPVPDGPPRQAFATLNESLPSERRFRKLGEVKEPVEADVYVGPEG